ncbi:Shedu immune nuclease family protein [Methylorubrum populi]|uniref:Shedu immune nuclease family protein n=1 Tax=Methylorubrum populi TaxID=223967 RepID=UPI003F66058F
MALTKNTISEISTRREDGATLKLITTPTGLERLEFAVLHTPFDAAAFFNGTAAQPTLQEHTLADYDNNTNILRMFPITTGVGSPYLLEPKYNIKMIALEGQSSLSEQLGHTDPPRLEALPSGFVRDPFDGLGLIYPLRFIIDVFNSIDDLKGLVLTKGADLQIVDGIARLPLKRFDKVRKAINRAHGEALRFAAEDKAAYLKAEILVPLVPDTKEDIFRKPIEVLRQNVQDALRKPGQRRSATANAKAAIQTVRRSVGNLASEAPAELYRLNRTIESVALADLIAAFEEKLKKQLSEQHWQNFFTSNPFILRLAFGFPVAIFGEQVSVGGGAFNGSGGKLADYVVRSGLLGNVSLVEIKKPGTALVEAKSYRGGVHAPTKELSGAVTQVLDQRYRLQGEIGQKKLNTGIFDVFAYSIQCIVIAGRIPDMESTKKSLEIYRSNLRDVVVITFDELLEKLKALEKFLSSGQDENNIEPKLLSDDESINAYSGEEIDFDYEDDLEEE